MKNPVTERLVADVKAIVKPAPAARNIAFLAEYYHRISGQDYRSERVSFFYQAARSHLKLASRRANAEALIDVSNIWITEQQQRTLVSIVIDDKPFIINSLTIALNQRNYRLLRTNHPVFEVVRNSAGKLLNARRYRSNDSKTSTDRKFQSALLESFIQFELEVVPPDSHADIVTALSRILSDIDLITADWQSMSKHVNVLAQRLENSHAGQAFEEYSTLLRWMAQDHFAFLGYCEVDVNLDGANAKVINTSLCGILKALRQNGENVLLMLPPLVKRKTSPVIFTQSRQQIQIHRAAYPDCILIEHDFDNQRKPKSLQRRVSCIVGFVAGSTAIMPIATIPHLRNKAAFILRQSTLRKTSYAYKELRNILETLPRNMLFQMDRKELYGLCMTLLNQQERRKTRLHIHRNIGAHFFSCLVYIPRDLFNTKLRQRILQHLQAVCNATEVTFNVYFSESILTRIHYTIHTNDATAKIDPTKLEMEVQTMARDWNENLYVAAQKQFDLVAAESILKQWRDGFPGSYQDSFDAADALHDIARIAPLRAPGIASRLKVVETKDARTSRFKIYSPQRSLPLSDVLPILENMGVRVEGQSPFKLKRNDAQVFWIHDFELARRDGKRFDCANAHLFEQTFAAVWDGQAENDGFNQLTQLVDFDWRQVSMLRAYFHYLKQIRLRYSENYIVDVLMRNPQIVVLLGQWFDIRFNPQHKTHAVATIRKKLRSQLADVQTLDEERIFTAIADVINATLRTNFFQRSNGVNKAWIAFKLDAGNIPRIPAPAPRYEIFVYSPRIEGVHLRGGKVARGGLRWSERPEDFRTEVLGLVKAQRVKNAVIVPVGSKGCFIARQLPTSEREQIQNEVIACYRIFISALLDLTDNIIDKNIVPPADVVRHDDDDPYLVVAADKGTATFSDIANAISADYKFWLGDAFASGGSNGYDHKKMGITARGAWESVKRHFRELDKDIQNQDFSVIGIGDMAGDVFGNGMLLSKHIRLIAAFNHLHIFIDPEPDAESSFNERQRLFNLPSSSWTDYNPKLISKGGGVYPRAAKSVSLSKQAKQALSAKQDSYAPSDLINLILKSRVELLWNGGIGTYVKASTESHQDAQDSNNDELRVNATDLMARVIGEGGNLGMTQPARIEFSRSGGLCYTDAIDNSAGVDTSDHEVNIKILLNQAIKSKLLSDNARTRLLAKMEAEIATLVLRNNYQQTQTLSLEANFGAELFSQQVKSIELLEAKGLLNRQIEHLPSALALKQMQPKKQQLTRAELAVLLSYSKMDLYQQLLDSELPDDPYLEQEIEAYFPKILVDKFAAEIQRHPLKREIISTQITNDLVAKLGVNLHLRLHTLSGAGCADIARAYIVARDILGIEQIDNAIASLDNKLPNDLQSELHRQVATTTESIIIWLLRNRQPPLDIAANVNKFRQGVAQFGAIADRFSSVTNFNNKIATGLATMGLDNRVIKLLSNIPANANVCALINLSTACQATTAEVAEVFFAVSKLLDLDWITAAVNALPADDDWSLQARFSLSEQLGNVPPSLSRQVLLISKKSAIGHRLKLWSQQNENHLQHLQFMIKRLKKESALEFAMLSVLVSALSRLTEL